MTIFNQKTHLSMPEGYGKFDEISKLLMPSSQSYQSPITLSGAGLKKGFGFEGLDRQLGEEAVKGKDGASSGSSDISGPLTTGAGMVAQSGAFGRTGSSALGGAASGASLGSFGGPVGTGVGAGLGGLMGLMGAGKSGQKPSPQIPIQPAQMGRIGNIYG